MGQTCVAEKEEAERERERKRRRVVCGVKRMRKKMCMGCEVINYDVSK